LTAVARLGRPLAAAAALLLSAGAPLPGLGPGDGRVRIDPAAWPWTAVARLQIPGVSRCTAVLIGPTKALTAAHCLWERRLGHFAPADTIHVLSRYTAGGFAGHTVAASYQVSPGFNPTRPDADRAADVAVVTLAEPLGGGVLALAAAPPPGAPAMLGGYNQDRAEVIEADTACHVVAVRSALLVHDCAGTRGTSGAPLLVRGPDGAWRVAGLQVAAFTGHSGGVAVAASVLQDALDHPGRAP
jgi:protease YdgD